MSAELQSLAYLAFTNRQYRFRWVELQLDTFFSSKSNIKRRDIFKKKFEKLDKEFGIPELEEVYDEIYDMNTPDPKTAVLQSEH